MADDRLLRRAAERASQRPFYLAASLLAYARRGGLDDAGLAADLGCDLASLPALLLCRQPSLEVAMFRADVEAIARRFGLNAARLGQIIRTANTLVAFGGATPIQHGGLLAAARDREEHPRQTADAGTDPAPSEPPADGHA
jgi:hypothetical protein